MPDHLDTLRSVQPWWRQYVRRSLMRPGHWVRAQLTYPVAGHPSRYSGYKLIPDGDSRMSGSYVRHDNDGRDPALEGEQLYPYRQTGYRMGPNGLEWCSEDHFPGPVDLIDSGEMP